MKQWTLLCLCVMCIKLYAQKTNAPLPELPWNGYPIDYGISEYFYDRNYSKAIIYLDNDEAVFPAVFEKDMAGAVKLDKNGKELWEVKVPGFVFGLSLLKNNIGLFYGDYDKSFLTALHAVLIDNNSGKILKDQVIYEAAQRKITEVKILNKPSGSFQNILVRVSNSDGKKFWNDDKKTVLSSLKLIVIELDNNLTVRTNDVKVAGQSGLFIGALAGHNNDLFFCSILNDQLLVEHLNNSGSPIGKLQTPFSTRKDTPLPFLETDAENNQSAIMVAMHYENQNKKKVNQVFYFDFRANKILKTTEEVLDKDYAKSLEPISIKKLQNGDLKQIEHLKVAGITQSADRYAVVKEISFTNVSTNGGATRYRNDALVVSIYDREWKLLKPLSIDKKNEVFISRGGSLGIKAIGDKLYLLLSSLDGAASYATLLCTIDMKKMEVESYIELDKSKRDRSELVEAGSTLWFSDAFLIQYLMPKGGLRIKNINSMWQKVAY